MADEYHERMVENRLAFVAIGGLAVVVFEVVNWTLVPWDLLDAPTIALLVGRPVVLMVFVLAVIVALYNLHFVMRSAKT